MSQDRSDESYDSEDYQSPQRRDGEMDSWENPRFAESRTPTRGMKTPTERFVKGDLKEENAKLRKHFSDFIIKYVDGQDQYFDGYEDIVPPKVMQEVQKREHREAEQVEAQEGYGDLDGSDDD